MELKIGKLDVPRVATIYNGDEDSIAAFLGHTVTFVESLLKFCEVDPDSVPDELMKKVVILTAETHAEIILNTVKALQTQSGEKFLKDIAAGDSEEGGGNAAE